jgi:hypothetical protein
MMERCPYCAYKVFAYQPTKAYTAFECGTTRCEYDSTFQRSTECYETEIEDLKYKVENLKYKIDKLEETNAQTSFRSTP